MNKWTKEEIALTRFAWGLKDMEDQAKRVARARYVCDIVVAACMGVACVAVFVLSQW